MPSAILLAHIEMWVAELQREVQAFEDAVDEVEQAMDEAESCGSRRNEYEYNRLRELDDALQTADRIAELVCASNATLLDAIDAVQHFMSNEQHAESARQDVGMGHRPSSNGVHPTPVAMPRRVVKAKLDMSGISATQNSALLTSPGLKPLSPGTLILRGRYRIAQVLHTRPRVNLYMGYRLPARQEQAAASPDLVAIRELVLSGLAAEEQEAVVHAAFEEFASPMMFGSPHLPGVGDRVAVERERHYLVMQLRPTRGTRQAVAVPLSELVLAQHPWPAWLDMRIVREWGIQLCRIIGRLHRMGCVVGDLDPATILVDSGGAASWTPVLLVSGPPAPQCWPSGYSSDHVAHIFPIVTKSTDNMCVAPEMLQGRCDERSDVYAMGALLYLLFTRYAPVSSALRLASEGKQGNDGLLHSPEGQCLVPPHLLNSRISTRLESILTRTLALDPAERFSTAFALGEALQSIDPDTDFVDPFARQLQQRSRSDSKVTKVLEWVKRELDD